MASVAAGGHKTKTYLDTTCVASRDIVLKPVSAIKARFRTEIKTSLHKSHVYAWKPHFKCFFSLSKVFC